ncbi:MAG: DUF4416 family protein [Candidatus Methylomirabilales bacterium]
MAKTKTGRNAKLFIAILAPKSLLEEAENFLSTTMGPLDLKSRVFPFGFTDYYQEEMGSDLYRRFVAIENLIPQDALAEIKHRTNEIERNQFGLSSEKISRRRVNLDPGYLTPAKIVLASTKDYAHKIYLGQGIFGDLQLKYEQGAYQPLPWTYPDYRMQESLTFFAELRRLYLRK